MLSSPLHDLLQGQSELDIIRMYTPMPTETWEQMLPEWKAVFLEAANEFLLNVRLGYDYSRPWPIHQILGPSCSLRKDRVVG